MSRVLSFALTFLVVAGPALAAAVWQPELLDCPEGLARWEDRGWRHVETVGCKDAGHRFQGPYTSFHDSGFLESVGTMWQSSRHGLWTERTVTGGPESQTLFSGGVARGERREWWTNGHLRWLEPGITPPAVPAPFRLHFDSEGRFRALEGRPIDLPTGRWRYDNADGTVLSDTTVVGGDGIWRRYEPARLQEPGADWELDQWVRFAGGKRNGLSMERVDDALHTGHHVDDRPDGVWTEVDPAGPRTTTAYVDGLRHGGHEIRAGDGTTIAASEWERGRPIGSMASVRYSDGTWACRQPAPLVEVSEHGVDAADRDMLIRAAMRTLAELVDCAKVASMAHNTYTLRIKCSDRCTAFDLSLRPALADANPIGTVRTYDWVPWEGRPRGMVIVEVRPTAPLRARRVPR